MTLRPDEIEASRLFPLLTGLQCEEFDGAQAGDGLPDFKLVDRAGASRGTLEVTQHTSQDALATLAQVRRQDWSVEAVTGTWIVQVDVGVDPRALREPIEQLLQQLEAAGENRVSAFSASAAGESIPRGVCYAFQSDSVGAAVRVQVSGPGGTTGRDVLADVVESEVVANQHKLTGHNTNEHHLLVWLDWWASDGADVMASSIAQGLPGDWPRDPQPAVACSIWLALSGRRWAIRWDGTWSLQHALFEPPVYAV